MLATLLSRAQFGLEAPEVRIDVHVTSGLPAMAVVGLPQTAVKESRDRVRSAILSAQFAFPAGRITVNLSPADLPKGGGRFDLPIAVALLIASEQLPAAAIANCELYGELSLGGEVRPIHGILPAVMAATREGRRLIVPSGNLTEAQLVHDAHTATVSHLTEIAGHLQGIKPLRRLNGRVPLIGGSVYPDLSDVRGQTHARRAIEIAADTVLSARLTIPAHWSPWSEVAPCLRPVRFPSHIMVSCSSMSSPSLIGRPWSPCANRWRPATSASPAPATEPTFLHSSS